MSSPEAHDRLSPELRAALFHFTVFGSTGAASAYLAIWLSGRGISAGEIGIINAAPVLMMLSANMLIGRLADRASDWRVMIVILALISGAAAVGFFLVSGFWGYLLVWTLTAMPAGALVPIVDAATLRMTTRRGTDFGFVRAWGTVGYTVATAATGLVVGWLGPVAFVPIFVAFSVLRAGLALPLPRFRAPAPADLPRHAATGTRLRDLMALWFLLPCLSFALIQSTHLFLGTMGALVFDLYGVPEGLIGILIAVSAAAEAAMMFAWRRVARRMSARLMLIIACVVCTVRWLIMAMNPPIPLLFLLQASHGITYPFAYFGLIQFIATWAPEDIAAEAQGFSSALTMGVTVVALVVFGWLVGAIGGLAYIAAAVLTFAGALAAWGSIQLRPVNSHAELAAAR
jgi:PPP family 3-phenylpropionic acid transporter